VIVPTAIAESARIKIRFINVLQRKLPSSVRISLLQSHWFDFSGLHGIVRINEITSWGIAAFIRTLINMTGTLLLPEMSEVVD